MRSIMWTTHGSVVGSTFMYGFNYSPDKEVQIVHHATRGTEWEKCWQIRRILNGKCEEWFGKFATAEEAYEQLA